MEALAIALTVVAAGLSFRPRRLPVSVLIVVGGTVLAAWALVFAGFLYNHEIALTELVVFALAMGVIGLIATRFSWVAGVAVAAAGGVAVLVLHGFVYQDYLVDDAFISFRYSTNLAAGNGIVWNAGERVEGYTNFLWVLLLTPFEKFDLNTPAASRWLGFLAAIAAWPLGFALLREWGGARGLGSLRWSQTAFALLLPTCGAFTMWAFGGLETTLFATLALTSILLVLREDSRENAGPPWSAFALLAVALTRFDGVLLFLPALALKGWSFSRKPDRENAIRFGRWLAAFALPYLVYFGWRWGYYGYPLPNTFYAKVDPEASAIDQFERGVRYLDAFARDYAIVIAIPALISLAVQPVTRRSLYVASIVGGWSAYVVLVGGDFMIEDRFFVPLVPLLYVLAADGLVTALWSLRERADGRALAGAGAFALLAAMAVNVSVSQEHLVRIESESPIDMDRRVIGRWLRENVSPDTVVLLDAAGAIPYYSELPAVDILGINDETIAHTEARGIGKGKPGHEKSNVSYVMSRRPDMFIEWHGLTPLLWGEPQWRSQVVQTRAAMEFLSQPETFDLYEPVSVQIGDRYFNYLRLRESARTGTGTE